MGDINRDPSMEEILASIKRVISEETPPAPAPRARVSRAKVEEEDVLELSDPEIAGESLVSEGTASASRTKLAELAEMRRQGDVTASGADGPLEALVREMLKPILKQWLDQRLPEIVEELVTREITRITSGKDN
jgi:cell pole-organizing protein PopZ